MDKTKIKTLQDLIRESAAEYGDKIFLKEKKEKKFRKRHLMSFIMMPAVQQDI